MIELKGYSAVFPNAVYEKDSSVNREQRAPTPAKQIVLLNRYTLPTQEQAIAYLLQKAHQVADSGKVLLMDGRPSTQGKSALEIALGELDTNVLLKLRNAEPGLLRAVRTIVPSHGKDRHYASVRYGIISSADMRVNRDAGNIGSADWYHSAFSAPELQDNYWGEWLSMAIPIVNGSLLDKSKMLVLADYGYNGPVVRLRMTRSDDEVKELIGVVYEALCPAARITELPDSSEDELEDAAMRPVSAMLQAQLQRQIGEKLAGKQAPGIILG